MTALSKLQRDSSTAPAKTCEVSQANAAAMVTAIVNACNKIAPLWPLKHFVAVNPFLGFTRQSFAATCATLRRIAKLNMLMPRGFYRQAIHDQFIQDQDLDLALERDPHCSPGIVSTTLLKQAILRSPAQKSPPGAAVATVAEVLDHLAHGDRQASRTAFMIDEISKWCAAYFDEGQAAWRLPWRHLRPYAAWRASMQYDRNPEAMGIRNFRQSIAGLPDNPIATITTVIQTLGIPQRAIEEYLHRALLDIGGWAAYARYQVWNHELVGRQDDTLVQVLAIRLAWGYALYQERKDADFAIAWGHAMAAASVDPQDERLGEDPDLAIDLILQEAYEAAFQRRLLSSLAANIATSSVSSVDDRRPLQAAFCIDVRSETYRRALESICPQAQTFGFAGFFGFPIEYLPIGRQTGGAQCPVLLTPAFVVCETVAGASPPQEARILNLRLLRRRAAKAWKAFKLSAVSSFTYVETLGLLFAGKILGDSAGLSRPVQDPNIDGLDAQVIGRIGPRLEPRLIGKRMTGFDAGQRIDMAEAVLRAMSLTADFAPLVLLAGHGSTTVNNPHASALDCGACGGHTGEANARVAAAILNDPSVRAGLEPRGIFIPCDTWFVAGLHDTTTDALHLYDLDLAPSSHNADLAQLALWLESASCLARKERSPSLGILETPRLHSQVTHRSRDWSQVRPEWGLAGNAVFIAAPRERTRGMNLHGRAFLHTYDWQDDDRFQVLELIMTAPMIVASWINLQYYGSTVNNRAFGSGNKTLHNVVGQLGVLEGNAGDLKVGLPWQSVHDGTRFIHEPLRLNVIIEAPEMAITRIIEQHERVRDLIENRWIHLFALGANGKSIRRYAGALQWRDA